MRLEVTLFSTARTTPSGVRIPTAVEPSWREAREGEGGGEGKRYDYWECVLQLYRLITQRAYCIQTLIASIAYSTWNNRPSGENVFTPLHVRMGQ